MDNDEYPEMSKEGMSNCCYAPVIAEGGVAKFYRCSDCKEPCDLEKEEDKLHMEINKK